MRFSDEVPVFHTQLAHSEGWLVGYAALKKALQLPAPFISKQSVIHQKHTLFETDTYRVFTPRHAPVQTMEGHLLFALKYEGIDVLMLKHIFRCIEPVYWIESIQAKPQSKYWRRLWFLYEWVMGVQLPIADLHQGSYFEVINPKLQYGTSKVTMEKRFRIKNNLPGVAGFCPLICRSKDLDAFLETPTERLLLNISNEPHLQRALGYVSLGDSRSSFEIEGERTNRNHELQWASSISNAGNETLTIELFEKLQKVILGAGRSQQFGLRTKDGFVGEHDRQSATPRPEHISARWQDLQDLLTNLIAMRNRQAELGYHPVLSAASLAFGFVYIHPFSDGNGRLHRYLIHHVLLKSAWPRKGFVLPISEAILTLLPDYASVLQKWSHAVLPYIDWKEDQYHNVQVNQDTSDFYRYFDATHHTGFLVKCIQLAVQKLIPHEIEWLGFFEEMKRKLQTEEIIIPDQTLSLMLIFLRQNAGAFSKRAREQEFASYHEAVLNQVQALYHALSGN